MHRYWIRSVGCMACLRSVVHQRAVLLATLLSAALEERMPHLPISSPSFFNVSTSSWLNGFVTSRQTSLRQPSPQPISSAVISPHSQSLPPPQERHLLPVDLQCLAVRLCTAPLATAAPVLAALGPSAPVAMAHPVGCTGCSGRQQHSRPGVYRSMGKAGVICETSNSGTL